ARERGKTLILVTHSPEVAALADRTLRLDHGRLVEQVDARRRTEDGRAVSVVGLPSSVEQLK
ncbi:MAG: ABC transporter ATP-binding protein, partial [Chloroflexota bacterium]|nr:ABC transporter ATP-binding protein [Chloroflexota bacterium]